MGESLASTLRGTLQLRADEELIILSISAARRLQEGRSLQAGGVKVDFVIGLKDAQRAATAEAKVELMATGNTAFMTNFVRLLDTELTARGKAPAALDVSSIGFAQPVKTQGSAAAAQISAQAQPSGTAPAFTINIQRQQQKQPVQKTDSGSSSPIMTIAVAALAVALLLFMYQSSGKKKQASGDANFDDINATGDAYTAKIAATEAAGEERGSGALEFEDMKMG